jgi:hypothetical protein
MKGIANRLDFSFVAWGAEHPYLFRGGRIPHDFLMTGKGLRLSVLRQQVAVSTWKRVTVADGFDPPVTAEAVNIVDLFRSQGMDGHKANTEKYPHGHKETGVRDRPGRLALGAPQFKHGSPVSVPNRFLDS